MKTQIKTIIYDVICVGRRAFLFMTSLEPRVAGPVRPATLAARFKRYQGTGAQSS
jgi:hypothetical protein